MFLPSPNWTAESKHILRRTSQRVPAEGAVGLQEVSKSINRNYLPLSLASHTTFYCSIPLKPSALRIPRAAQIPPQARLIAIIAVGSAIGPDLWEWRMIAGISPLTCKDRQLSRISASACNRCRPKMVGRQQMFTCCGSLWPEWLSKQLLVIVA